MERRAPATGGSKAASGATLLAGKTVNPITILKAINPLSRLVRLLSSIRLAMALILGIALVVLVGTVVDQVPPVMRAEPAAYARWLDVERGKYGSWTDVFQRLDLFNVFHSTLFRGLIGLLAVSILVCTLRRWRSVWTLTFHTRVRMTESFLAHARFHERLEATLPLAEAAEQVRRSLSGARYRVRTEADDTSVAVFAEKNRFSRFGTFFTHLGLILVLVGAIAGGVWGFKDPQFVVAEGSTKDVGQGTNLALRLDRFTADYYPDGRPKAYLSEMTVLKDGKVVKQATVGVNSPLHYGGIAFHESYYGPAAVLKVEDSTGKVLFEGGVPLTLKTADGLRPEGSFELPEQNLLVYVIGPMSTQADSLVPPGEVRLDFYQDYIRVARPGNIVQGQATAIGDMTFTFEREGAFTGMQVVKDPGVNLIWVAGGLMIVGMVMLFYLPPRRLWALCKAQADGGTEVLLGMQGQRDMSLAGEFEKLRGRVAKGLGREAREKEEDGDV